MQYKVFGNEILYPEDVNDLLMRQAIVQVDNDTERDSIEDPHAGLTVYNVAKDWHETYDGANWQAKGAFAVGSFICPSSTGNFSVTGLGFRPKMVEFTTNFATDTGIHSNFNSGVMTADGNQWLSGTAESGNGRSSNSRDDACLGRYQISTGGGLLISVLASYVSMDSDGFTVNFSIAGSTNRTFWKAWA